MRELVLRLEPGADIRQAIEMQCQSCLPGGGFVLCAIGSLLHPVLRLAGRDALTRYDGPFEILTLSGSVATEGAHLHVSISSAQGEVFGGHVAYGNHVRTTAEVLIVALESWQLSRRHDAATGFAELVATPRSTGSAS
ncbi:MAG TPA: PPC domain-containing DNA-binding protein [Ramlibacter sp.]|nr:PPC domain-containing DNA-binding protein [Ramlibacter sp.]